MDRPPEEYTPVDTALAQVLPRMRLTRRVENIPTWLSHGRIPAADVYAPADVPRFATSHWDGFAAMAEDLREASDSRPVSLRLVGLIRPGVRPSISIKHGEAVQVGTGAPLPSGADTVVPVESATVNGRRVTVVSPAPPESHVYQAGEDVKKGELILSKGRPMRAQDVGYLLGLGCRTVKVWMRPRVSVIATGTELTDPRRPQKGKVVNSHSLIFDKMLERLGCVPDDFGIVKDDPSETTRRLKRALTSDLILTLGGTSAGKRDYVARSVEALHPEVLVHGVKMDRGRVAGIAVIKGKPVVMMPGPIQGAMNAFLLLAIPIIEVICGAKGLEIETPCVFSEAWQARNRYADFRKVVYVKLGDGPPKVAKPLTAETESMRLMAEADGYTIVPENVARIDAGDRVMVRLLPGFSFP